MLTRGQLEKMSYQNLIASFLALQDNIILQQNDLLQQNRDISKKLLEITSKIDSLAKRNLCPYYRYLYGLVKEKKAESLIIDFWVFNGTIRMRELQDSRVINITHESDI